MLSNILRPQIRKNAVSALFEKQDVFIHNWTEACATYSALRIIISEQQKQQNNNISENQKNKEVRKLQNLIQMREELREASFRVHVPRTIEPTTIGREFWSPLKISSKNNSTNNFTFPPFSDEEFQQWIKTTSPFSPQIQVGAEGYCPLPCFISSFESLTRFYFLRNNKNQNSSPSKNESSSSLSNLALKHNPRVLGKQLTRGKFLTQLRKTSNKNRNNKKSENENNNLIEQSISSVTIRGQNIHYTNLSEAEPYRRLLKFLEVEKSGLENEMIDTRNYTSENLAKMFFRAALIYGGGSNDGQFALSLVRDLGIGDLFLSSNCTEYRRGTQQQQKEEENSNNNNNNNNEDDVALKQFIFSLKQAAKQNPLVRELSSRARTFSPNNNNNSNTTNLSSSTNSNFACFPPLSSSNNISSNSSSSSEKNPPRHPHSMRPSSTTSQQDQQENMLECSETDFNLAIFQTPVEPLLPNVLLSASQWNSMYHRDVKREIHPVVLNSFYSSRNYQKNQNNHNNSTTTEAIVSTQTKETLQNFDLELLPRMSSDVGGFVAVVCPTVIFENNNEKFYQEEEENENENSNIFLPNFFSGRLGQFPFLIGTQDFPLHSIWLEQYARSVLFNEVRQKFLHFETESTLEMLFADDSNNNNNNNSSLLKVLTRDPFQLDYDIVNEYENNSNSSSSSSSSSCFLSCDAKSMQEFIEEIINNNNKSFSLRLMIAKCPPGVGGVRSFSEEETSGKSSSFSKASKKLGIFSRNENSTAQQQQKQQEEINSFRRENLQKQNQQKQQQKSSSLVIFNNTWEHDHYLPRNGPNVPHHFIDDIPTFSYLDEDHIKRRRGEIERRQIHGQEPHEYSEILFPSHSNRVETLSGSKSYYSTSLTENDEDFESTKQEQMDEYFASSSHSDLNSSSDSSSSSLLSAAEKNSIKQNFVGSVKTSTATMTTQKNKENTAAKKLRDAQMKFGTVGAIFEGALKKRQLQKAATTKEVSRNVDRHLSDERFFNEKIMPAGETAMMVNQELRNVGVRKSDAIRRDRVNRPKYRE